MLNETDGHCRKRAGRQLRPLPHVASRGADCAVDIFSEPRRLSLDAFPTIAASAHRRTYAVRLKCILKQPAAMTHAVLCHQLTHALPAYAYAASKLFFPHARPAVLVFNLCLNRLDMRQRRSVARTASCSLLFT